MNVPQEPQTYFSVVVDLKWGPDAFPPQRGQVTGSRFEPQANGMIRTATMIPIAIRNIGS